MIPELNQNWRIYFLDLTTNPRTDPLSIRKATVQILNDQGIFDGETVTFSQNGTQHGKPYYEGSGTGHTLGVQVVANNQLLFGHKITKTGVPRSYRSVFVGLHTPRGVPTTPLPATFSIFYRHGSAPHTTGTVSDIDRTNKKAKLTARGKTANLDITKDEVPSIGGVHLVFETVARDELLKAWILPDSTSTRRPIYMGYHWLETDEFFGPAGSQYCTRATIGNVSL